MFILTKIEIKLAAMSRRSIFLLAAAVVMLYFSIILFMLSPLHGSRGGYYAGGYMNNFAFRHDPPVNWCSELKWQIPPSPDVVALVSYPGSGNTWLRYLLQQVTGVVTGSIYMDYGLRVHGFPAENVTDGSVLVVKTHAVPMDSDKFRSAILLIRNPRDAILFVFAAVNALFLTISCSHCYSLFASCAHIPVTRATELLKRFIVMADFHRLHRGHIGTAPKSAFKKKSHENKKSDWSTYVSTQLTAWETLNQMWLTRFPGPLHIVFYEVLVRDTRNTLQGILDFLNYNVTEADMNCAMANKEGIYRRKKKHQDFEPFTADMYKALDQVRNRVLSMVMEYKRKHDNSHVGKV